MSTVVVEGRVYEARVACVQGVGCRLGGVLARIELMPGGWTVKRVVMFHGGLRVTRLPRRARHLNTRATQLLLEVAVNELLDETGCQRASRPDNWRVPEPRSWADLVRQAEI